VSGKAWSKADELRYREFNSPRLIPVESTIGGIKAVEKKWIHRGVLRSEAYVKRYFKKQLYDLRIAQKRANGGR
jgi:hypothetical protein